MRSTFRVAFAVIVITATLAACGGGGGDDGGGGQAGGGSGGTRTTDVTEAAQQSVAGLVAYLNELVTTMTNNTSEPILLGTAVLPTSDTTEPLTVN